MARCLELNGSLDRCLRAASFQLMGKYSRTVFKDARYAGMRGEKTVQLGLDCTLEMRHTGWAHFAGERTAK